MQRAVQWVFVIMIAVLAFLSSPTGPFGEFWPPPPGSSHPTFLQVPFFILLNIFETLSFGGAVVLLFTAFPTTAYPRLTLHETQTAFLSLIWTLGNWWVHDSLHVHIGDDFSKLLIVEYVFHVTIMMVALYLLYIFAKIGTKPA